MRSGDDRIFYGTLVLAALVLSALAVWCEGTGDGGDSIVHYQYARYAWAHPENFFDHWAKPFFTMLAFPFSAAAGFTGIKLFNVLCSAGAAWFGYKILVQLDLRGRWAYALLLFSATLFVKVTLSGLTEPLSALMLTGAVYCMMSQRIVTGLVLISFIPFVRSEGLIMMSVFAVYLFAKKNYRALPWLFTGHVVMSLAGSFYYHDLLWVFNRIPYLKMRDNYGSGSWTHFPVQLVFQFGPVIYTLFIAGCIGMLAQLFSKTKREEPYFSEKLWLIYGSFFCFLMAHASFWSLNLFNSMGLVRVFVSVTPLALIIAVAGLHDITGLLRRYSPRASGMLLYAVVAFAVIHPFFNGPSGYALPDDFALNASQKLVKEQLVPHLQKHHPAKTWIVADMNVPFFSGRDPFRRQDIKWYYDVKDMNRIGQGEVIVCDSWFAPVEWDISQAKLRQLSNLREEISFTASDRKGKEIVFSVFIRQ